MKIVRRLSDGLVQYKTTEPHELTDKQYKSDGVRAIDINNTTHEVVEDVTLPLNFIPGIHAYNNGIWSILNQDLYDNIIEEKIRKEKKQRRIYLLKKGVIADNVWFNELFLGNFISATTVIKNAGGIEIEWKDNNDEWIVLNLEDANLLAIKAMSAIQEIYKNN